VNVVGSRELVRQGPQVVAAWGRDVPSCPGSWESETLMATIKKKDLIDRITVSSRLRRSVVRKIVQDFLDQMTEELERGNRLEFRDFGVFEVRARAPRTAQNPRTMERVQVPARNAVRFKAGRELRERTERAAIKIPAPVVQIKVRPKRAGAAVA
jgi:integration host factor subunit beta